jgi:hypothetical protein
MLLAEVGVAALALFFHLRSRVAILAAFGDYGTSLPSAAALALSPRFLPVALGLSAGATLVGIVVPLRRRTRLALVGGGLMVSSMALMFAIWQGFRAAFQPG